MTEERPTLLLASGLREYLAAIWSRRFPASTRRFFKRWSYWNTRVSSEAWFRKAVPILQSQEHHPSPN